MTYYVRTPKDTILHNIGVGEFQTLEEAKIWAHARLIAAEIRDDNDKIVYEFDERNLAPPTFDAHDEWRAENTEPSQKIKCPADGCGKPPNSQHHCDNWNCPKLTLTRS